MTAQENRTGPLNTPDDVRKALVELVKDFNALVKQFNKFAAKPISFVQLILKPTTLSGYGIVDAAPLHHRHDVSDIDNLPAPSSGIVAWSAITGKPYTVAGFGIVDASVVGHHHHWTDIVDPPSLAGPPGPPGLPGGIGLTGGVGPPGLSIPGLDGISGQDSNIPGPRGKDGKDGRPGNSVIWSEVRDPIEPLIVPGKTGAAGAPGAPGAPGSAVAKGDRGAPGFDGRPGVDGYIPGPPGQAGVQGFGQAYQGVWNALVPYFSVGSTQDVVRYGSQLWIAHNSTIGVPPGTTADWRPFLFDGAAIVGPQGRDGPPGPEPMMIPGPRGPQGVPGAGTDPVQQSYAPGTFAVPTGKYTIGFRRLTLTGAQRASYAGTAAMKLEGISG